MIEGRRGFCKAFDELPFDLRRKAVRVAHGMEGRKARTPRRIACGFPVVEPDTKCPGHYIAYRCDVDGVCGRGESDLDALDDLERREPDEVSLAAERFAEYARESLPSLEQQTPPFLSG